MDAFSGRWELRAGIRVPVIEPTPPGRRPQPTVGEWTPDKLRQAHRRYAAGDTSLLVREGERLYQRERKRAQRSGAMSPADRSWAEKNAVKFSWDMDTRTNRRASVTHTN